MVVAGGGTTDVSAGEGSADPSQCWLVPSLWTYYSQFSPHSQQQFLTHSTIHCFHYCLTGAHFREQQRSGASSGRMRARLESDKKMKTQILEFRASALGSCIWVAVLILWRGVEFRVMYPTFTQKNKGCFQDGALLVIYQTQPPMPIDAHYPWMLMRSFSASCINAKGPEGRVQQRLRH